MNNLVKTNVSFTTATLDHIRRVSFIGRTLYCCSLPNQSGTIWMNKMTTQNIPQSFKCPLDIEVLTANYFNFIDHIALWFCVAITSLTYSYQLLLFMLNDDGVANIISIMTGNKRKKSKHILWIIKTKWRDWDFNNRQAHSIH